MFLIAFRNLIQEKGRLLISVGGVGFSVLLIMILVGLYQGWNFKMGEYIRTVPADLWVEQAGGKDMFHSISILPASAEQTIERIEGVKSVRPFSGRRISFDNDGKEIIVYLVGFDASTGAGPVRVVEGKDTAGKGEVILDRTLTDKNNIKLGQKVTIGGKDFTVAGIAEGGNVVTLSYAFINASEANDMFKLPGIVSYFIVQTEPGANNTAIASQIEQAVSGSKVVAKEQFAEDNTELIRETFLPVILVLVLIGIAVGIAVIGLTIFTSTIEKAREYGVLKAVGIKNRQLYSIVIIQSVTASAFGYIVGVALAIGLSTVAAKYVAEFVTLLRLVDAAWILGLALVMAITAAYLPARRLAKIDPAEVFRA